MTYSRKFRSAICILLAISTIIHTTPLYAIQSQVSADTSSSTQVDQDTSVPSDVLSSAAVASTPSIVTSNPLLSTAAQGPSTYLSTGAAAYSYPIEVPPGRAGIAPNLALTYNSYNGNGWCGVGFDLGLGSIQRATKNGLDYNANDYVAVVNGSSAELVSRSALGAGYYGNKIEGSFLRYYHDPLNPTGGWVVTDKNGTKYYYGTTAASRQNSTQGVFAWYLDRVEDINGNYMTASYEKDGDVYLQTIEYTGNSITNASPTNRISFLRAARSDTSYVPQYLI